MAAADVTCRGRSCGFTASQIVTLICALRVLGSSGATRRPASITISSPTTGAPLLPAPLQPPAPPEFLSNRWRAMLGCRQTRAFVGKSWMQLSMARHRLLKSSVKKYAPASFLVFCVYSKCPGAHRPSPSWHSSGFPKRKSEIRPLRRKQISRNICEKMALRNETQRGKQFPTYKYGFCR